MTNTDMKYINNFNFDNNMIEFNNIIKKYDVSIKPFSLHRIPIDETTIIKCSQQSCKKKASYKLSNDTHVCWYHMYTLK